MSSARLLHEPLQFDSPTPQQAAGVPDKQLSPLGQLLPQVAQFASSLCVSLHKLLQHVSVPPHAVAHVPQCASSLVVSTHVPPQFV